MRLVMADVLQEHPAPKPSPAFAPPAMRCPFLTLPPPHLSAYCLRVFSVLLLPTSHAENAFISNRPLDTAEAVPNPTHWAARPSHGHWPGLFPGETKPLPPDR